MNEDKRKLEEAEERQVGPKKQKNDDVAAVEEQKSELKTSEIDQENEVSKSYAFVSPEEELMVETEKIKQDNDTLLEDETSGYLEDPGATRNGHLASIEKKDDASNGSCSVLEGEDVATTKNVNEALASSDGAASNKKEGNSRSKEESEEAEPSNIKEPISFSENRSSSEEPPEEDEEIFTDREAEDPSGNWEKLVNDVKVMDATPTTENLEEGGSLPVEHPNNPATLGGQTSGSKTLFLGNLSFSIERGDVDEFFKDVGEIVDIQFAMNEDDTFRGFGHIEFATVEAAEKALRELNGKHLLRRRVRLDFKREKGSYTRYSGTETSSNQVGGEAQGQKIFVRGFDKNHGEDKIRSALGDYFGSCGEITRISIPKDRDGCFKGIAYIDFKDADAFNNALELNGSEFGENTLTVEVARSRDVGSGRFGGRGDGGGAGGHGYGDRLGGTGRGYGGHFEGRGRGYGGHSEEGGGRGYGGHSEGGGRGYGGHSEGGGRGYGGHSEGGGRGYGGHSEGGGGRAYRSHSEDGGRGYGGHSEGGGGRGYGGHSEGGGGRGYGGHFEGRGHGYGGHSEGRDRGYGGQFEGGRRGYSGQFEGGRRGYSGHFESRSQGYGGHSGGGSHGYGGHFRGGEHGGSGHFGRNRHGYGGHFGGDDNGYSSRVGGGGRGW